LQWHIRPCARCGARKVYVESRDEMTVCDDCALAIAAENTTEADQPRDEGLRAAVEALAEIREAHEPQPYDFPTKQTYCPSSDVPTDQCHTCIVLALLADQPPTPDEGGAS
jgi:ribosome-binding protein aMBF1 (putative translation factor)